MSDERKIGEMTLMQLVENEMDHEAVKWIAEGLLEGRDDALHPDHPGWAECTAIAEDLKRVAARLKRFYGVSD